MSTSANATTIPACSAPLSSASGSIPATTSTGSYVVPTCIPEPSGNVTYTVSYTSSGATSLPYIVPITASSNATATATSTHLAESTVTASEALTTPHSSVPFPSISNGNHTISTQPVESSSAVPVPTSHAPATTSTPTTPKADPTSAPSTPSSTPSMSSSVQQAISSTPGTSSTPETSSSRATVAVDSTSVASTTSRTVSRPTVTITEIYTGPPAGTPSISRTSAVPVTTSVAPVPTTTAVPEPITSSTSEILISTIVSDEPLPTSNTFSYYTETLTFPSTTILSIITTDTDAFPTSFPSTSLPITSVNDPSSTPLSSYIDSLSTISGGTSSPTLVGTVTPTGVVTTLTTPVDQPLTTPPTSPTTTSSFSSSTLSALPAPEGSNAETTATTANPSGVIAGGTVAGVVGLIALAGVSRWVWKRGANERAVRRMYRDDMRQIRARTDGLEEGPGQWGRPAWRRGPGSSEGSV